MRRQYNDLWSNDESSEHEAQGPMPESIVCGQLLHTETILIPSTGNCGLGHFGHVGEVEPGDRKRVDERGQVPVGVGNTASFKKN